MKWGAFYRRLAIGTFVRAAFCNCRCCTRRNRRVDQRSLIHRPVRDTVGYAFANPPYSSRSRHVGAFLAAGLEQEPGAALGLVDEGLEQARSAGILVLVGELMRLAHRRRHMLVVFH
jgi:hypothetical protein